ncbi:phosphate signaling complex protein PhoU [Clostridium estertheticum]|uniref:Phosphate-specific transport system accessory protein PhoU n=2 Tax=Clostridium estertheticum TaxID=238834 RepID=A0A1J0GGX1_9CLOT|nr:phosphate signaling complex protein PhoU [Clostridium estertheticum]APC40644.1 phosphate transport system regulatory protein PhoU [Clostridium estertheticum subsp. estertheticum]MBU3074387.1 phosphate signaling complex protein PhoU [Clostridium estertheticum]MBU3164481.1 phosphate signaling complex protein PhoU [Clostridium estertheticum]MBU3170868.1 phosphate signaling complex protein PhoU [Clostridium estertheticum]MBU3184489.1 phosphate signaling complex protein PhoU [Clostridium esterth
MARKVFEANLQELHNDLIRMGSIVEKQIYDCIDALVTHNIEKAQKIMEDDDIVDVMEREIEDKAIRLIAMQQPLAIDLRNIFTTTKIVTDLERMADYAVDVAKITVRLKDEKYIKQLVDIPRMAEIVVLMIRDSLDAYVSGDIEKAYAVCKRDDEVDDIYKEVFGELLRIMFENQKTVNQATQFLFICKWLERIADHTTNICEWTIYLVTGEKVNLNE